MNANEHASAWWKVSKQMTKMADEKASTGDVQFVNILVGLAMFAAFASKAYAEVSLTVKEQEAANEH